MGITISHEIRILTKQPGFNGTYLRVSFGGSVEFIHLKCAPASRPLKPNSPLELLMK